MMSQKFQNLVDFVQTHAGLALLEITNKTESHPRSFGKLCLNQTRVLAQQLDLFADVLHLIK